jgi:hypothetical protein
LQFSLSRIEIERVKVAVAKLELARRCREKGPRGVIKAKREPRGGRKCVTT